MSDAMVVSGIVCLMAAVVGGAFKWPGGLEIRELPSLRRQALLGTLGAVLLVSGVVLGSTNQSPSPAPNDSPRETPVAAIVTPFAASSSPPVPSTNAAPSGTPSATLPPIVDLGIDVDTWRRSSESVCKSAIAQSAQAPDPVAWAEVFVGAAQALRSVESPTSIATQVDEWHSRVDDVVDLWRQVASARVLGDAQSNLVLTQQSATAARLANQVAGQLGLPIACYLTENV